MPKTFIWWKIVCSLGIKCVTKPGLHFLRIRYVHPAFTSVTILKCLRQAASYFRKLLKCRVYVQFHSLCFFVNNNIMHAACIATSCYYTLMNGIMKFCILRFPDLPNWMEIAIYNDKFNRGSKKAIIYRALNLK